MEGGELMHFDRVLAKPPFSIHWGNTETNADGTPAWAPKSILDNATLKGNDYNLNIRRYADNALPPEPHDVRAHLVGGVPKAEVADKAAPFQAHGLNPLDLLAERDAKYSDFKPTLTKRQDLKPASEDNAGLVAKEAAIRAAFEQWWRVHSARITALAGQMQDGNDGAAGIVARRNDLLASFST